MNEDNNTQLPEILAPLAEKMARQVHITWMQGRLDEGWTFGPVRDDRLKTHPCLVEYDELPEREREYHRRRHHPVHTRQRLRHHPPLRLLQFMLHQFMRIY